MRTVVKCLLAVIVAYLLLLVVGSFGGVGTVELILWVALVVVAIGFIVRHDIVRRRAMPGRSQKRLGSGQ